MNNKTELVFILDMSGSSKDFEFIARGCSFTDDTVMTCAVAQTLMDGKEDFSDLEEKSVAAMQRMRLHLAPFLCFAFLVFIFPSVKEKAAEAQKQTEPPYRDETRLMTL